VHIARDATSRTVQQQREMSGEESHKFKLSQFSLFLISSSPLLHTSHNIRHNNQPTSPKTSAIENSLPSYLLEEKNIKVIMSNHIDNNNNASFEDRHFLSDPRPIPSLELATWDVDILRQGVDTPIMTIRVDNSVLPPRKSKKKTVWKLPDSIETIPKFGTQDKRRIFDLFREKKKELKKLKNKQRAYRRASTIEAMSGGDGSISGSNDHSNNDVGDNSDDESSTYTAKKDTCPPRNGLRDHQRRRSTTTANPIMHIKNPR
jgi:Uri superfamily endonuclease